MADYSFPEQIAGIAAAYTAIDTVYDIYNDLNEGMKAILDTSFDINIDISVDDTFEEYILNYVRIDLDCHYPELFGEIFSKAKYNGEEAAERVVDEFNGIDGSFIKSVIGVVNRGNFGRILR